MTKTLAVTLALSATMFAQTAKPSTSKSSRQKAPPAVQAIAPGTNVSLTTVQAFMRRMFGQDPTIRWEVRDIGPSEIPNVAKVVVTLQAGDQPAQGSVFYVMPDGEHAMLGEVIPFGADPFAPARKKLEIEALGPRLGAAAPTISIVEFSDLQCPYCKAAQPIVDQLMKDFPNARLTFQNFPLSQHKWAAEAATVGICVSEQSTAAFWKYVNAVYAAQETIQPAEASAKLADIVKASGADPVKAAACAKLPATAKKLQDSLRLGQAVGVTSTPTVFVNGRKLPPVKDVPYETLKQLLNFELQESAAQGK